jgi:anaerobic selenocysteine-containing dehydrogenase
MIVHGSCHHDCPDTCMWEVTVAGGRAVRLRGSSDHSLTAGQLCPKVNRFLDRVYHPDRLLAPLRRTGRKGSGCFERIGWDTAIATIADHLGRLVEAGRAASILQFSFDGTQGVIQKGILADRIFDALGASDIDRHLCGMTSWLGAADVSGVPFGIDPELLSEARTIVLWGTDTTVTAAIRTLVGPEHRAHGRDIMRAIAILPAVTGAWRDVGGGLARSTQTYFEAALNYPTCRPQR